MDYDIFDVPPQPAESKPVATKSQPASRSVKPVPPPLPSAVPGTRRKFSIDVWRVIPWMLLFLLAIWVVGIPGCPDGGDDFTPIPVESPSVLFAVDATVESDVGLAQVASSAKVKSFCDDSGIAYRRYDVRDDLSKEDEQWRVMMDAAKEHQPPNMVTVDVDGRGGIYAPATVDAAIEILKTIKQ